MTLRVNSNSETPIGRSFGLYLKYIPKQGIIQKKLIVFWQIFGKAWFIKMKKAINDVKGIDYQRAMMLYDDDDEMFEVIVESFVAHAPVVLKQMETLFAETAAGGEASNEALHEFGILAHGIKGSCSNIAAEGVRKRAEDLEKAAKDNDPDKCQELYPLFLAQLKDLLAELE